MLYQQLLKATTQSGWSEADIEAAKLSVHRPAHALAPHQALFLLPALLSLQGLRRLGQPPLLQLWRLQHAH